ncbi:hypothetical protein CAMRE0001_1858 [Campylobacter rectus RM3267]|uniref:Uncharacterized protein n=1 Tax=Campylobacter rectus RM3267 TaxID=553218 RepID=B9CYN1_CAMRE|nr:hypothetical protein CAMRE0001_1858 [Campylobacter rectus RM3267]
MFFTQRDTPYNAKFNQPKFGVFVVQVSASKIYKFTAL